MNLLISLINETTADVPTEDQVRSIAEPLMTEHELEGEWLLDLSFVSTDAMRQLNREAQGHDEPTDVLSFPVHFATNRTDPHQELPAAGPQLLGSIVLAPAVAASQAPANHRTVDGEISFLIDHGLRHLLGNDHNDQGEWLPRSSTPPVEAN